MAVPGEATATLKSGILRRVGHRIMDRLLDNAIDALIWGGVLFLLTALVTSGAIWGGTIADWLSKSEPTTRWLLLAIAAVAFATPVIGSLAVRRINRVRFREAANIEMQCLPGTFDLSGVSHGFTTATVRVTDAKGRPAKNAKVEIWAYSRFTQFTASLRTNKVGIATVDVKATPTMTPGILVVQAFVLREGQLPLEAIFEVTCVGGAAFITMTAAPNRVVAGQAITVLTTVTDAINQKVADTTKVQMTSSTGQMNPALSETFGGVATSWLLTNIPGPCTVVATVQGSPGMPPITAQVAVEVVPPPIASHTDG